MKLNGAVCLVTGAAGGIGTALTRALLDQGAAKIYACDIVDPDPVSDAVRLMALDVTDPDQVAAVAGIASDVTVVINSAGVVDLEATLSKGSFSGVRRTMEVNLFGTWAVCRAFAPILAGNGGGALVNVVSVSAWRPSELLPGYSASKAAVASLTNAFRLDLRSQNTLVTGVYAAFVDTPLAAGTSAPKITATSLAGQTVRALLDDNEEVLGDAVTRRVKANLSHDLATLYEGDLYRMRT